MSESYGPYRAHRIAAKYPMLDGAALASLAESIRRDGQIHPCVVWGDCLIDGRNRWRACEIAGVEPKVARRSFADERECGRWIVATNERRDLSQGQRAMLVADPDILALFEEAAKERQGERTDLKPNISANLRQGEAVATSYERKATTQAAAAFGVSGRSVQYAKEVRTNGAPEVVKAVEEGRIAVSAAALLSRQSETKQREIIAQVTKPTRNEESPEVRPGLVRQLVKQAVKQETARRIEAEPAPMPTGPFRVIVSDPPWAYEKRAGDASHRIDLPYPSMTTPEIAALDVQSLAHPDGCILWLWTTNAFMRDAYKLLDAWGFQEKTILTWVKDRMGMGDWLRGQTEHCILAIRGKPTILLTNQTTALNGPLREHSRKPDEFYALVESICPGSKVEMFCRTPRAGWAKWGAETEKFDAVG